MKKFLIAALLLLVVLLAACRSEPLPFAGIFRDVAQPINVRVGQEFTVAVVSNPATAYMWREEFDKKLLEVVSATFEINEELRGTEAMLEQHYRFKALKKGQTEVTLNLQGPDLQPVRNIDFEVNIK